MQPVDAGKTIRETNAATPSLLSSRWAVALLLGFVIALSYANSLQGGFVFDDLGIVLSNIQIRNPSQLPEILGIEEGKPSPRFVRTASYTLDYLVAGLQPWGYHLFNLLYHLATTLLVYTLARRLLEAPLPALLVALLFAVHPVHTEAVTYISGRRDLLTTLFTLWGVLAYLRYREAPTWGRALGLLGLYLLALFAKEMAITLPLLCLAYEAVQPASGPTGRDRLRALGAGVLGALRRFPALYGSLFTVAGGFGAYIVFVVSDVRSKGWWGGSLFVNLLTVARIWVHYLALLLFPKTLLVDYSYNAFPVTTSLADGWAWAAVALLGLLAVGWFRLLARSRVAAFGGLWFAIALLPVSHIVPHHELMAEHHLYLPSVGLFLLVGWAVGQAWAEARWRTPVLAGAAIVLLLLAGRTVLRNRDWQDDLTLWSTTVQTAPNCLRCQNNLGNSYFRRRRYTLAEQTYKRAMAIDPEAPGPHNGLGMVYGLTGRHEEAVRELKETFRLAQERTGALNNLGAIYAMMGKPAEAENALRMALDRNPRMAQAWANLGKLHLDLGQFEKAAAELDKSLQINPYNARGYYFRAQVYTGQGEISRAMGALKKALQLDEQMAPAQQLLTTLEQRYGRNDASAPQTSSSPLKEMP